MLSVENYIHPPHPLQKTGRTAANPPKPKRNHKNPNRPTIRIGSWRARWDLNPRLLACCQACCGPSAGLREVSYSLSVLILTGLRAPLLQCKFRLKNCWEALAQPDCEGATARSRARATFSLPMALI